MKITKLFEIILILAILCILFKIFYSMSYKICKLYRNDIKKRLALKDENYIFFCYPHTSYLDGFFSISSSLILSWFSNRKPLFPVANHQMKRLPNFLKKYIYTVTKDPKQTKKLIKKINDENCSLYIAPEGTRSKADKIKKGFYYIAKKTNLPIICTTINFNKMETYYSHPIFIGNRSIEDVFKEIKKWYKQFDLKHHCINEENLSLLQI